MISAAPDLSALKGRSALVTGGSGFIGRRLTVALLAAGAVVTQLSRARATAPTGVRILRGDMADPAVARHAVSGQDLIFNLAYDVRRSGPANLAAFTSLLNAAEAAGRSRLIHMSSIVVYDGWPSGDLTENSPMTGPGGGPYRQTKIAMEHRLMQSPLPVAILQPTLVWGSGSALWTDRFLEALRGGGVVLPQPEGFCQGLHVEDLVQASLLAALVPDLGRERFLLNGPAPFPWSDLIGGYRDLLGRGHIRFLPAADLRPAPATADADAASGPALAARISALGRRLLGHARFEALLGQVRRLRPPVELRPDASLFALYTATGQCPPTHAMNRLGYCPRHDLATGLTAIARTSPQP